MLFIFLLFGVNMSSMYKDVDNCRAGYDWIDYSRMSVGDIEEFIGWEIFFKLILETRNTNYYPNNSILIPNKDIKQARNDLRIRDRDLIASAFLTGGRINEVLMLHTDNFRIHQDYIEVINMPVLKRYKKNKNGTTTSIREIRDPFPIPRWEPFTIFLESRIKKANQQTPYGYTTKPIEKRKKRIHWLFPSTQQIKKLPKLKQSIDTLRNNSSPNSCSLRKVQKANDYLRRNLWGVKEPGVLEWIKYYHLPCRVWYSQQRCYQIARTIGERVNLRLWMHFFRSQRASLLGQEYGFLPHELNRFFSWKAQRETSMAEKYSRIGINQLWEKMEKNKEEITVQSKKFYGILDLQN